MSRGHKKERRVPTREKVLYREMARLALESVSGGHRKGGECQPERRECIEKWPGLLIESASGGHKKEQRVPTREKMMYREIARLVN